VFAWLLATAALAAPATAQAGDGKDPSGRTSMTLPPDLVVPAAPVLTPEQARDAFALPDDLLVELVAAEPLVVDPVAAVFDGDGSLWVVEMRGFMPNVDGTDELEPVGRVARLHDDDGDGAMDRRDDFLTDLVLPRALVPTRDGVLVIAPPDLLFCRDTDGDGVADERRVVHTGLSGLDNPEHAINSLTFTLDNAFAVANQGSRWRWDEDELIHESVTGGGQWGLTQDALGRLYFNTNSDALRGHAVPPVYGKRHPEQGRLSGIDRRVASEQAVFPSRITPGVNRGYQPHVLKDWRLVRTTAACGPLVHLGDGLPERYRGDAFVCEPAANLVKRYVLEDDELGRPVGTPGDATRDWLSSTDERFRPVDLIDGPDGAVYVVDLYRGILQHRVFMTTYLRQQVLDRGLDKPVGLGRIWRVRAAEGRRPSPPPLAALPPVQQVARLSHTNGHLRLAAQQHLVEAGPSAEIDAALVAQAAGSSQALGRVHALWTLQGRGVLGRGPVARALGDDDARVRETAIRLAEPHLISGGGVLAREVARLVRTGTARERTQGLLTLGTLSDDDLALELLASLAPAVSHEQAWRSALLNGLAGRGTMFLAALDELDGDDAGHEALLRSVSAAVGRSRRSGAIAPLLELAAERPPWQAHTLLAGLLDARPPGHDGGAGRLPLADAPAGLDALLAADDPATAELARDVHGALWWPDHPVPDPARDVRPLADHERALFERGRGLFSSACADCHQPNGKGAPGKAPPLVGSPWALGSERRVAAILVYGLSGPLEVHGQLWDLDMPALAGDDEAIAAVLTYVRREWGNGAEPVTPELVASVRDQTSERDEPFTVPELLAIDP
jgi:mono/diheme cytochrome c family protein/glucose/arabinose dehydrogenase